ncbi:sigma-70 family RNA polymerase sigma factor [Lignipirellula cremea]|uniref:ECF RNA polymerase sigma factor SigW n=1 Tax=Lignipirellula cremea TaxID=2528010 RepID=A0A518E4I8_9BACT|nr:sigma-70 family RNA polymerase sigma factor [Lignipirellula cremea]QDU98978.1 ECF RNA polymerase sigma factor SigW [Lignipirellula cremea]
MDAKALFEILVRENADMLTAFIRSAVRDDAGADDLFQETMLTAWRRLDDYDQQRAFGPWLRGIASKLILAHFRKKSRGAEPCEAETLEHLSFRFQQLHTLRGDTFDEKLDALRDCVGRLSAPNRESIELRYGRDLGLASIAETLGLAVEAVKKRLLRARTQLLQCIRQKLNMAETRS